MDKERIGGIYDAKLRDRLGTLDLTANEVDVIIAINEQVVAEMRQILAEEEPQIKRATGVAYTLEWIEGDADDPLSCIRHSQGFQELPEAMRKHEQLDRNPQVVDLVLRQVVLAKSKAVAYYILAPEMDDRNLTQDVKAE